MPNRIRSSPILVDSSTTDDCYSVRQPCGKPFVMRSPFFMVGQVVYCVHRSRVCLRSVGTRQALLQGWLCVSALCALQMCLTWCVGLSWPHKTVAIKMYHVFREIYNPNFCFPCNVCRMLFKLCKVGKC